MLSCRRFPSTKIKVIIFIMRFHNFPEVFKFTFFLDGNFSFAKIFSFYVWSILKLPRLIKRHICIIQNKKKLKKKCLKLIV